jgi:hypothetical protein
MELIKKEISTRDIANGDVHFKISLNQTIDSLGMVSDMPYGSNVIVRETNGEQMEFNFDTSNTELKKWHKDAGRIVAVTDSKLQKLKSYDISEPYKKDLNIRTESYKDYKGDNIDGVDRVVKIDEEEITYVMGAKSDINIGTSAQTTGLLFVDNPKDGIEFNGAERNEKMITTIQYMGEGWNDRNTSRNPQIQYEHLIGIISQPEVESDVFIERGVLSIFDKHLRLSEIESLDHLERYGNGFYNINRD